MAHPPGMKTYGQFCPIAQALEIVGERWTLLVLRELSMGSTRFSQLQRGVPRMSRTLLAQRLRALEDAGLIERREGRLGPEYSLLPPGAALGPMLDALGEWGKQFAHRDLPDEHLDPKLLMWDIHRGLLREHLPKERAVVLFRFSDAKKGERRFWLRVSQDEVDVCYTNPGSKVDLTVDTDVRTLTEVWLGKRLIRSCIREGAVVLEGRADLVRAFPSWLALSHFA